jgi:hypothetical protein
MTAAGEMVGNVLSALRRASSPEDVRAVWRMLNKFYFQLASMRSWRALRLKLEVSFVSATEAGVWLPANLLGVDRVRDVDDGTEYMPRDLADTMEAEDIYRYALLVPTDDPLFTGTDLILQKKGTTFQSTQLAATDHTGAYVRFGSEPGLYKLSAAKTFAPAYNGTSITSGAFSIRPKGTQKMVLYDPQEELVDDASVDIYYWQMPTPLYLDTDVPLFPADRALELMVMREALSVIAKRQLSSAAYQRDVDDAVAQSIKDDGGNPRAFRPRTKANSPFSFDRTDYFTER